MTSNDQTSDKLLTEEVYRPRQSEGNCPACQWQPCTFACTGKPSLCKCAYHRTCMLESVRDEGAYGTPYWQSLIRQIHLAEAHDRLLADMQERIAKRILHNQNKANAQSQLGPREFTLTYSPSWFADDDEAQRTMRQAIDRLTAYYTHEIIEFHAVGEFGADGRSHVHGWYHLAGGRKITDKNFRRAYPRWNPKRKLGKGFEGGHHETIQRVSDFAGYAEKHLDEAWLKVDINNADDNART